MCKRWKVAAGFSLRKLRTLKGAAIKMGLLYIMVFMMTGCSVAAKEVRFPSPPEGMVYIPEGRFPMGSTGKEGRVGMTIGVNEIPQHEVYLKGFYIDRFEVTAGEFRKFLKATGRQAPRIWREQEWINLYPAPAENQPMNGVSWYDADAYCRWAGKRLPTEAEWEKAARGTDGRQWPWGNEPNRPEHVRANTQEAGIGWTVPVGIYPGGVSPYGIYDMAGNVMEWTSSWYQPYPGSSLKRDDSGEKYKILKGGSWENSAVPLGRSAYRHLVAPEWDHPGHGFRCAMDAEESLGSQTRR